MQSGCHHQCCFIPVPVKQFSCYTFHTFNLFFHITFCIDWNFLCDIAYIFSQLFRHIFFNSLRRIHQKHMCFFRSCFAFRQRDRHTPRQISRHILFLHFFICFLIPAANRAILIICRNMLRCIKCLGCTVIS